MLFDIYTGVPANNNDWQLINLDIVLPKGSAPGKWGLSSVRTIDLAGNSRDYSFIEYVRFDVIESDVFGFLGIIFLLPCLSFATPLAALVGAAASPPLAAALCSPPPRGAPQRQQHLQRFLKCPGASQSLPWLTSSTALALPMLTLSFLATMAPSGAHQRCAAGASLAGARGRGAPSARLLLHRRCVCSM